MIIELLRKKYGRLIDKAQKYNVNITVFIVIYIFSLFPYYLGVYLVLRGSGVFSIRFGDLTHFDFSGLSHNNNLIIWGLLINRLAWALPYLYVLLVGKGVRWYIHIGIWIWIGGSIAYFLYLNIF